VELVRLAHRRGLAGLALTDHNTTAGHADAAAEAAKVGLTFLAGIEISCAFPRPGTLHMLGYGVDARCPALRELIAELGHERDERVRAILGRLASAGVNLSMEELLEEANGGAIGRPHVAALLLRHGHVATRREAFDRFLGQSGSAYVDTHRVTADRAIATIRKAGGVASLAHPLQLRRATFQQLTAMIEELVEQGMRGLETLHPSHATWDVHRLTRLADRMELVTTGGSDFHGHGKSGAPLGHPSHPIPRAWLDVLLQRIGRPASG
jgi:predicted metal-dependent phosphoesterase TrpH